MRGDFMAEEISRERILTELAELAFCRSNDAVRLVFIAEEAPAVEAQLRNYNTILIDKHYILR